MDSLQDDPACDTLAFDLVDLRVLDPLTSSPLEGDSDDQSATVPSVNSSCQCCCAV